MIKYQINLIHKYKMGINPGEYEDVEKKYSYAIFGDYGSFQNGQISKEEFFDYSKPFNAVTKLSNGSNVDVVIEQISEELNKDAENKYYENSEVVIVDKIQLT